MREGGRIEARDGGGMFKLLAEEEGEREREIERERESVRV